MDKDIQNEIDKIEGIVTDTNDTDAVEGEQTQENNSDSQEEPVAKDTEAEDSSENEEQQIIEEDETDSDAETADDSHEGEDSSRIKVSVKTAIESDAKTGFNRLSALEAAALRRKRAQRLKLAFAIPAIVIIIAGMVTLFLLVQRNKRYDNLLNVDYFYEGVYVEGIALGGLSREEANEKIQTELDERISNLNIVLQWDDEKVIFGSDELDISNNAEEIVEKAWNEGRSGKDKQRYDYVMNLTDNPVRYNIDIDVDASYLEPKIKAVALFRQREPGEASVRFDPDPEKDGTEWFDYTEPEAGIKTDPDALWDAVLQSVEKAGSAEVEIEKWEIPPTTTLEDLKNMTQRIVQFKSHMARNSNREHNVRLACSMINGTVLMPGEIFSFNETTGKRTKAAGFKEANVIVGGNRLEPGIAGGVCQVSGTLFNAVVRADLEIVERQHHSFELSYLTRGRDATVNYGTADLRFKNTSDYPVYISMYTIGREVYAEVYGMPLDDGMTIELYVKTTRTVNPGPTIYVADSSVVYGQTDVYSARTGIKCTTYKDYYDADGKLVDRVELHSDYYRPFAKEIHYNPAAGIPAS